MTKIKSFFNKWKKCNHLHIRKDQQNVFSIDDVQSLWIMENVGLLEISAFFLPGSNQSWWWPPISSS